MELRRYGAIIKRAWWLVLGVPLLVLLASLPFFRPDPQVYRVIAKVNVTHAPVGGNEILPDMNIYNSWQSSQFIMDDLPSVIKSRLFADKVSAWIKQNRNLAVSAEQIQSSFDIENTHRTFSLIVNAGSSEAATAIAAGSVAVLQQEGLALWGREQWGTLAVEPLDIPQSATALSRWPQPVTKLALRLMLAFVAGLALAFLRHYLDQTVRDQADLERLAVPILATIPKEK